MYLRASGCYYHPGRLAVATCAKCGVGICRECAVKDEYGTILCYQCGNEKLRQQHKEHRKQLKESGGRFRKGTEFIIPGIIGTLIAVVILTMNYYGIGYDGNHDPMNLGVWGTILMAYCLFSIPFAYIMLNDLLTPKYDTLLNRIGNWGEKILTSLLVGWIAFTFIWIRFIVRKITSNKI